MSPLSNRQIINWEFCKSGWCPFSVCKFYQLDVYAKEQGNLKTSKNHPFEIWSFLFKVTKDRHFLLGWVPAVPESFCSIIIAWCHDRISLWHSQSTPKVEKTSPSSWLIQYHAIQKIHWLFKTAEFTKYPHLLNSMSTNIHICLCSLVHHSAEPHKGTTWRHNCFHVKNNFSQ